jgi:hypothetical protein
LLIAMFCDMAYCLSCVVGAPLATRKGR